MKIRELMYEMLLGEAISKKILDQIKKKWSKSNPEVTDDTVEFAVNNCLTEHDLKLGQIIQPLKAALSGRMSTPSVFDMMVLLGPNEVNERICDITHKAIS